MTSRSKVNPKLLTRAQIKNLQKQYGEIETVNPQSDAYGMLIMFLDNAHPLLLQQLATADIKFVSKLAQNRVNRKVN